jgi:hypothetical protein
MELGEVLLDDFEGTLDVPDVVLAAEEEGDDGGHEESAGDGDVGGVGVDGEAGFAAEAGEFGEGLDAVEEFGVSPVLTLEVDGVFGPVTGVNEGEVDEDATRSIAGAEPSECVAGVEVAVAPGVDGPVVPAGEDQGEGFLDVLDGVDPAEMVGDVALADGFLRAGDVLVPVKGFGFLGSGRSNGARGLLELDGGVEEFVDGGLVEGFGERGAFKAFADEPSEVEAAEGHAACEDAGDDGTEGMFAWGVIVSVAEFAGPAEFVWPHGELDEDASGPGGIVPGSKAGCGTAVLPRGVEPLDGSELAVAGFAEDGLEVDREGVGVAGRRGKRLAVGLDWGVGIASGLEGVRPSERAR